MTIDFEKSIITSLLNCVDEVGANLVAHTYQNLVQTYTLFIWIMVSIYVGFLFVAAMRGIKSYDDMLSDIFKVVFILMLIFNYHYFCLFIYDIFTKEPLVILKTIAINDTTPNVNSINEALDQYLQTGLTYANQLYLLGSWHNVSYLIFALLVFLMTLISMVFAAGLIILAKCATIILLALSPIFIFAAIFESTKGLFQAYLRHLITYALIPILTSVILMILFNISHYVLKYMQQFEQVSFKTLMPFLFLCGIQIYLLSQVHQKAAALGGGFSLPGFFSTLNKTKAQTAEVIQVSAAYVSAGKNRVGKLFNHNHQTKY